MYIYSFILVEGSPWQGKKNPWPPEAAIFRSSIQSSQKADLFGISGFRNLQRPRRRVELIYHLSCEFCQQKWGREVPWSFWFWFHGRFFCFEVPPSCWGKSLKMLIWFMENSWSCLWTHCMNMFFPRQGHPLFGTAWNTLTSGECCSMSGKSWKNFTCEYLGDRTTKQAVTTGILLFLYLGTSTLSRLVKLFFYTIFWSLLVQLLFFMPTKSVDEI